VRKAAPFYASLCACRCRWQARPSRPARPVGLGRCALASLSLRLAHARLVVHEFSPRSLRGRTRRRAALPARRS
jgi:hypothetical protein